MAEGALSPPPPPIRAPAATYRLQLRREFPLAAARARIPYLRLLGVSDLYLSPLHTARAGSVHGYDVIDHARLNPELGDAAALAGLLDDARAAGLGVVIDVVPNHACIADDGNRQWREVLEYGRDAPSAAYFDIDWDPPKPELVGKVLLPLLDEQYGRVLEGGLAVAFDAGRFVLRFGARRLPLAAESWRLVLEPALARLRERLSPDAAPVIELESIVRALAQTLPALRQGGAPSFVDRRHEIDAVTHRLAALAADTAAVGDAIAAAVAAVNGTPGDPRSFDQLERLLDEQAYRLANWRVAAHEINYRRFFDVNELAAVRVENPAVFADVHAVPFSVAGHPAVTGYRIDHVDGLSDPEQYLANVAAGWRERQSGDDRASRPFVVVEKILGPDEALPPGWIADGTTGYDFTAIVADVFVWAQAQGRLRALASMFGSLFGSFDAAARDSKRLVLETTLAAELTVLARQLDRVSEQHRYTRDFTLYQLQAALGEVIACFPVYRTYVRPDDDEVSARDAAVVRRAVAAARRRNPVVNASVFNFIEDVLLRRDPPGIDRAQRDERRAFVTRLQQLTGPVAAKGVEDTTFYRHLPLLGANEIGGNPGQLGRPAADVHRALQARRDGAPRSLSATATHDSKRGEDTRARLYVLSEVAEAWATAVAEWSALTAGYKITLDGAPAPDPSEEYLLYQTLVGCWPLAGWDSDPAFADRVRAYMTKARHEAKLHTSWINPNPAYDAAAEAFVDAVLDPARSGALLAGVDGFARVLAKPGVATSLSQLIIKIAAPGIPDFFQGAELWDFSLVDPDNRRLVDFDRRHELLRGVLAAVEAEGAAAIASWFDAPEDGRIKLWVTAAALRLRRARRALFESGGYQPLIAEGAAAGHVFAFARTDGDAAVLAIAGRFFAVLGAPRPTGPAWGDTRLRVPAALAGLRFEDRLTGRQIAADGGALALASVFETLPVALLETIA